METLIFIPAVPIIIGIIFASANEQGRRWWNARRLTTTEYIILIVLVSLIGTGFWFILRDSQFKAYEWLNGEVADKYSQDTSCSHCQTVCDARDDDDGNCTSSHTECDHSYDRHWYVETNYNFDGYGKIEYPTYDRQGLHVYEEWDAVQIGDAATSLHPYNNWLKPSGESDVFPVPEDMLQLYGQFVPPPTTDLVLDHTHGLKILAVGYDQSNLPPGFQMAEINRRIVFTNFAYNDDLHNNHNKALGPDKQANLQIVYVNAQTIPDPRFADLVLGKQRGAGKNDVTIYVATNPWPQIQWVRVTLGATEQGNELFVIKLRDAIRNLETADNGVILDTADAIIRSDFDRKQMAEFADRKGSIHPTTGQIIFLYIVVTLVSLGGAWYLYNNDPLGIE